MQPLKSTTMSIRPRRHLRATGWLLSFFLLGACALAAKAAPLRKTPYLIFPGDPSTMQVHWQAATTGPSILEWGTDTGYALGHTETTEVGNDHQHTFTLSGLKPGSKYFYRVLFEGTPYVGSFRTPPPAGNPNLKFLAYGDTRTHGENHNEVAGQMLQAISRDPELQSLIVFVGDLTSDGDSEKVWDREFFLPAFTNVQRLMAQLPFQSCMGNHEASGRLFTKYFPYPFVDSRYWSFDYGPAHFTLVDQYVSYAPGSAQYEWIRNDLATTTQPWRFVVMHGPGWSAGGGHSNKKPVQQYLQPLFVQHGVSIVFGGHNHYYARAVVDGVQHLTIGGGGAPLYTPNPDAPYVVTSAKAHHFCRITIEGGRLGFAAINGTAVLDTFDLDIQLFSD